jgi:predicted RNase H-like HicB family nuclease
MGKATSTLTINAVVHVNGQPFDVVLEKGPCNWSAFVPSLPGCIATGATEDEVKRVLQEAIERHLSALRKDKEERPLLYENCADGDAP